jgi:hypothetical protein
LGRHVKVEMCVIYPVGYSTVGFKGCMDLNAIGILFSDSMFALAASLLKGAVSTTGP